MSYKNSNGSSGFSWLTTILGPLIAGGIEVVTEKLKDKKNQKSDNKNNNIPERKDEK